MAAWDPAALLAPVSDGEPSGPNLEFDQEFGALNRAAEGKPERQSGNAVIPAEDPDWRDVETLAAGLLERTRDLRALVHLGVASLHRGGLPAYASALTLTRELLETRWDSIHPQLDPEDDNDPTARKNALENLAHPRLVLRYLRQLPVTTSRVARMTWRDLALATGKLEPDAGESKPTADAVRGAFNDSDAAQVAAAGAACTEALAALNGIEKVFSDNAGYGMGPDFKDLPKLLFDLAGFIKEYGPSPDTVATPAAEIETAGEARPAAAAARPAGGNAAALVTEIGTRTDAVRLLGLICQYYRRHEPSSPLPLLLDRALRLADKSFLDILRDLAPDGLMQAQNVVGAHDE
jgi:type VI secretion system protein ImpA